MIHIIHEDVSPFTDSNTEIDWYYSRCNRLVQGGKAIGPDEYRHTINQEDPPKNLCPECIDLTS